MFVKIEDSMVSVFQAEPVTEYTEGREDSFDADGKTAHWVVQRKYFERVFGLNLVNGVHELEVKVV